MAKGLSIVSEGANAGIMECPACMQTIDSSAEICRYCSAAIDPVAAQAAAEEMAKINRACSDASYLKILAVSIFAFLGMMFVPFITLLGAAGYYFVLVAVPFLAGRWLVRYSTVRTDDRDFKRARVTVIVISALWVLPILNAVGRWH